jgi:hypothetical protein
METFRFFLNQGLEHITDLAGYDHILFIIALCAIYTWQQWKSLALLVTAFTVGHSLSLALATLDWVRVPSELVEFLIPVSIMATALNNLRPRVLHAGLSNYPLVIFFGLIHGLGFSNYLRFLLQKEESLASPLLGFNLGLELGQLLILGLMLGLTSLALQVGKLPQRNWSIFVCGTVFGPSFILSVERGYAWLFGGG